MEKTQEEIQEINKKLNVTAKLVTKLYYNHSSDEYKSAGDITKSVVYDNMVMMLDAIESIDGIPKADIKLYNTAFDCLKKPYWKKHVADYIKEPDYENTFYVIMYTIGFRTLVAQLAKVFASSYISDVGFKYNDEFSDESEEEIKAILRIYNDKLDATLQENIKKTKDKVKIDAKGLFKVKFVEYVTEYELYDVPWYEEEEYIKEHFVQEDAKTSAVASVVDRLFDSIATQIGNIFNKIKTGWKNIKEFNPISLINTLLTRSYDKKVEAFMKSAEMYKETKAAYDEYRKIPASARKNSVMRKYERNIEKYNAKMRDLYASIKHYDQRAIEEEKDETRRLEEQTKKYDSDVSLNTMNDNPYDDDMQFGNTQDSSSNDDDELDFGF